MMAERDRGNNDARPSNFVTSYEMRKRIARDTSGSAYTKLLAAIKTPKDSQAASLRVLVAMRDEEGWFRIAHDGECRPLDEVEV